MSFHITQGLFQFDLTDHYAVLGVPLDAEANPVRKRYMQIARRLHPDSCNAESKQDQKLASDLLAKLVSPAYNQLMKERERTEYTVILKTMAKRLVKEKDRLKLNTQAAQELLKSQNLEADYKKFLQELTAKQYESFGKTLEVIGQISELNLVYILRKQMSGESFTTSQSASKPNTVAPKPAANTSSTASSEEKPKPAAASASRIDRYYNQAEEYLKLDNLSEAVVQLKEAIKIDPKNSQCHGLLGMVYLKQKQLSMAKIHVNQALKLNPQEPVALKAKKQLEKPTDKGSGQSKGKSGKQNKSGGGLFGLFGKKK